MDIREKANKYAEGKANESITKAIEQAYLDGYSDGYKKHEEEMPTDINENETEFIDLGLPSGTLWATDYERIDGEITYLPYDKANKIEIPTEEQWKELESLCKWEYEIDSEFDFCKAKCVGPNGNIIHFIRTGRYQTDKLSEVWETFFWIKDVNNYTEKKNVYMCNSGRMSRYCRGAVCLSKSFSGFKLAIRLVR